MAKKINRYNPKVSVVIPTYNRAHLIKRAIKSVLDQTFKDFEILVIDDGSEDKTCDVVKGIKKQDSRVRSLRHKKNRGYPSALNTGIKNAKGAYIAFQDDDDIWLKGKLKKQMDLFVKSSDEVGVVYARFVRYSGSKKSYAPYDWVKKLEGNIHRELLKGNFVGTPVSVVKKECFSKIGLFDTNLVHLQDWEMWIRISKYFQFRFIDQVLMKSFERKGSVNRQKKIIQAKTIEVIVEKHKDDYRGHKKIMGQKYLDIYELLKPTDQGNKRMAKKYLVKAIKTWPFISPKYWLQIF